VADDEKCVQVGEWVWKWHESVGWYDAMDDDPAWDTEIALLDEIERLRQRDEFIAKLDEQIKEKDEEIAYLKSIRNTQANILRRLTADEFTNTYFIHSGLGENDENGMPEKLLVCPAYGLDFSYVYEYNGKTSGTEW